MFLLAAEINPNLAPVTAHKGRFTHHKGLDPLPDQVGDLFSAAVKQCRHVTWPDELLISYQEVTERVHLGRFAEGVTRLLHQSEPGPD